MGLQSLSAFSIQESHNEDSMFFIHRLQTITDITLVRLDSDLRGFNSFFMKTSSELISTSSELFLKSAELIRTSTELIFPTSRPAAIHGRIGRHAGYARFALFCFSAVRCFNIYHSGSSIFLRHCYRKKTHPEQYAAILLRVKWVKGAKHPTASGV